MSKITVGQVIINGGIVGGIIGGSIGLLDLMFEIFGNRPSSSSSKKEKLMKLAYPLILTIYGTVVGAGIVVSVIGIVIAINMPFFLIKTIFIPTSLPPSSCVEEIN